MTVINRREIKQPASPSFAMAVMNAFPKAHFKVSITSPKSNQTFMGTGNDVYQDLRPTFLSDSALKQSFNGLRKALEITQEETSTFTNPADALAKLGNDTIPDNAIRDGDVVHFQIDSTGEDAKVSRTAISEFSKPEKQLSL